MVAVVGELRAEVEGLGRGYRGQRYPAGLRARLVVAAREMRDAGASWFRIQKSLGVRSVTLRRWCGEASSAVAKARTPLVPVQVVELGTVSVVSPSGWRVEGLSVCDAVSLLRAVS